MATLAELITDVRARLDEATAGFWTDAMITVWLNEANLRLATELEDIEAIDTQNTVASQAAYDLPTDLVKIHRVAVNSLPLRPITFAKLNQFEGEANPTTSQTGTPECFYVWADHLYLFPAPASSVTAGLSLWYYATPATLVNTCCLSTPVTWATRRICPPARLKAVTDCGRTACRKLG
jgi:hypothetical protein